MAIPDEDVSAVRRATDIVALIGEYTPLKRQGRRFVGLCPFHSEKTGSFSVNGEEGLYYCFGCQASGDAISFVRAVEGASFVEAVERLAARAGIAIREEGGSRAERDTLKALYQAMSRAVEFYHERLMAHPDASRARQYLRSRGLDGDVVRRFRLGWAPESGNDLVRALKARSDVLIGAGLAVEGRYGARDAFRGRVIFPICQPDGRPVALGGRLVPGVGDGRGPKYRNSTETAIYQKRSTLYGLDLSRQAIVQTGEVIVCEGYTDVIGMFRVGLDRAVATCGTALTEDHFKLLSRFARRVVLAFDADAAGQSAAARFYEWERRHEIEVAVADLPAGTDPGDMAANEPEALVDSVAKASSYLEFRLSRVLAENDLARPESRAKAAESALAVVAEHPNELVRDQYLMLVADRTRMDVERLRPRLSAAVSDLARGRGMRTRHETAPPIETPVSEEPSSPTASRRRRAGSPGDRAGRDALALAIHEPASMAPRLHEVLFSDPLQLEAYRALEGAESLHEAVASARDEVGHLLVELANSDPAVSPDQAVVALVRCAVDYELHELHAEVRSSQAEGHEDRALGVAPEIAWLKAELEVLADVGAGDHPPAMVNESADRLVAWLAARRVEAR